MAQTRDETCHDCLDLLAENAVTPEQRKAVASAAEAAETLAGRFRTFGVSAQQAARGCAQLGRLMREHGPLREWLLPTSRWARWKRWLRRTGKQNGRKP
jgi:hypothetical protein